MLAFKDDESIRQVMAGASAHTGKTVFDTNDFLTEARTIRLQRFALNRGEWRDDIIGIGAPISSASGQIQGALGLSAPASRTNEKELIKLAPRLLEYVDKISAALGCTPDVWARLDQDQV